MTKSDFKDKSDEELMESYKMGEPLAFEILFERHSGRVQGYLRKKLSSSKEAQDLVQDVFFKLHRSKHQYNSTLPFSPWLFSITRSVWLDYLKKQRLEVSMEQGRLETLIPVAEACGNTGRGVGREILDRLPENQKEAVGLRVFDEATFDEIASRLSTSPENARQLFSRGIRMLREILKVRKE